MNTYRHYAIIHLAPMAPYVRVDLVTRTYDDLNVLTAERTHQSIITDVPAERWAAGEEAMAAAERILTEHGWQKMHGWLDVAGEGRMLTAEIDQTDKAKGFTHLAEQQLRRGVDSHGALLANVPRCNDIGPDDTTACNLSSTHRVLDPADRHEYFQPIPGGRTLASWAHCAEPRCCHYAQTGQYCTGHALQAGKLRPMLADRAAD